MKSMKGFTLIELMIVVAIIGILASVALPAYNQYTAKSKFSEVVAATQAVKTAIEVCYQTEGIIATCDEADSPSVKSAADGAEGGVYVGTVDVTADTAVITATAAMNQGIDDGTVGYTYILTPTPANGQLTWAITGTCDAQGYC